MPGVSSLGAGSGMPLGDLLEKLMKVDPNQLQLDRLDNQEKDDEAAISAYGQVKSAIAPLQGAAKVLMAPEKLQLTRPVTVSDASVLSATATSSALAASYSVEISQLAQQQKLVATGQADKSAAINTGTLSFSFGTISGGALDATTGKYTGASFSAAAGTPLTVTIGASNNTLVGIRDAINTAGSGYVTATIINDGSGTPYRLALTSGQSGEAYSMQISVAEDNGLTVLANLLAHDPAGVQALSEKQTAQNTKFTIDGVVISKPTTQISDAIDGVTLQLNKTNVGNAVLMRVADKDPTAFTTAVNAFVKAYNEFQAFISKVTMSQAAGTDRASARKLKEGLKGPLANDSTLRFLDSHMRTQLMAQSASGNALMFVGLSFPKGGALTVDSAKLTKALATGEVGVQQLFVEKTTQLNTYLDELAKSGGVISTKIDGLNRDKRSLVKQRDNYELRLQMVRKRYEQQFSALDNQVSTYQKLSGQLTQLTQQAANKGS